MFIFLWLFWSTIAMAQDTIPAEPMPPLPTSYLHTIADETMELINQARADRGLFPLWKNESAICASALLASWNQSAGQCTHSKDYPPLRRLKFCGWDTKMGGEIVACRFGAAQEAVRAWLASPSHSAILLSPDYNMLGAAVVGQTFVVTFGKYEL